jgi:hypothetical protein
MLVFIWTTPSIATECDVCVTCHGDEETVHGNSDHSATLGSGLVVLFPDNAHDSAGWYGDKPYFSVLVDCGICHNNNLPAIHGNDCATCHPTPYDTLGIWGRGCQQGGCHPFYHEESSLSHFSVEEDCNKCHNSSWDVLQTSCLNCHAAYYSGDVTPPLTTSDALAVYTGPARIEFSITDNGKVGVGRTFYRLDGGTVTAGSQVLVTEPGSHELEFWSIDQCGNTESAPNFVFFDIIEDTTPPITTSDAKTHYEQGGIITLTATDESTQGVKATYYRLNDGPVQSGTRVILPRTSGTIAYTLTFWSEDWARNIEAQHSVGFTVTSGAGTVRLIWGNSEVNGSPCPDDPEASAAWTIRRGGWWGTLVASGSGACPNWDGVDDVALLISSESYYVSIDWWDSYYGYDDNSSFVVSITEAGQIIRLNY